MSLFVVLMLLATASCGRYARRGDASKNDSGDDNVSVGGDVEAIATSTTSPSKTSGDDGGGGPGQADLAANQSSYDSPEGFRLVLTVDGSLNYSANQDIKLSVLVWNISNKDLQFDPNDTRNFALRLVGQTKAAWTDGDCRGARVPQALETSAQTLHPNEQTTFVDTYPGPSDNANRDQCRVSSGSYSAFGFVTWCPPGSTDSQGVCDPAKTRQVSSAGVKIRIG
jgi:hypothetical protein